MSGNITRPTAVIDFSNNLIRFHKKTIEAIGSPENILLIINPEKQMFGIVACGEKVNGSHRVRYRSTHCGELYSKPLVSAIRKAFPCWDSGKSYRISGNYIHGEQIVCFELDNSVPVKNNEDIKEQ